ncbi:hypothetical protein MRX96_017055 [Rhipicephalus microplus]
MTTNPPGSRASPNGSQAVGRKDTAAPEKFREKEHAEVKPQIAEEGEEAEGMLSDNASVCVWHKSRRSLESWGTRVNCAFVAEKLGQLACRLSKAWH